jgi:hypothetical protein
VTRQATMGGIGSMRSAVTAFAMATAHLVRTVAAGDAGRPWARDGGEGSPRVVADMRIQVGSGASVLGRTGGGILPPASTARPCPGAGACPCRGSGRVHGRPKPCAWVHGRRRNASVGDARHGIPPRHLANRSHRLPNHPDLMPAMGIPRPHLFAGLRRVSAA